MTKADVLVVGSGQAGVPLATRLAARGRTVVIFEEGPLGGTCVNTGCTPTKTILASAEAAYRARGAGELGVRVGEVEVDFRAVMARKDDMVARWRRGVEDRLDEAGERLRVVRARARFVGAREVEADGERYAADTVILNVGAKPVVPSLRGLEDVPFLDHRGLLELDELPVHLVALGGGAIACELGQAFRRFGADVTLVERAEHLLPGEDTEVSEALEKAFETEGIGLRLGEAVQGVEAVEGGGARLVFGQGPPIMGSHLLVAVGRRPATDDLGLDEAGIETDDGGAIVVDDGYGTSTAGVYAVGDCTGGPQFTHASWDDHRILFDRLEGDGRRGRSDRIVPYTIFTDPQVARVGLDERRAREAGVPHVVASLPVAHVARARETGRLDGVLRILLDPASERILGASLVGDQAGELVHVLVVLMQAQASARALLDAEMVHPAWAEGLQSALTTLERYALD